MNPASICRRFVLIGLLTVAACGGDGGGSSASNVGTLAYVVTSCREVAGAATVQQELRILPRRGETVTAMSVGPWDRSRRTACAPRMDAIATPWPRDSVHFSVSG